MIIRTWCEKPTGLIDTIKTQKTQRACLYAFYVIDLMGWLMGLEPTTTGITTRPPKITHKKINQIGFLCLRLALKSGTQRHKFVTNF